MIDYISAVLEVDHQVINNGQFIVMDETGEVKTRKPIRRQIEGSYEAKLSIKSQGAISEDRTQASELYVEGNVSKFLQGHNVFGSDNLLDLMKGAFIKILTENQELNLNINDILKSLPYAYIKRVDFTKSMQFETRQQVRAYLKQLSLLAHTRTGRLMHHGSTVTWTKTKRWSVTCYGKGDEIQNRPLNVNLPNRKYVEQEADCLARVECRWYSKELKERDLEQVYQFTPQVAHNLYAEYLERIKMTSKVNISSNEISNLSPALQRTFYAWKNHVDVVAELTTPTFYRHRSAILKQLEVDISLPYMPQQTADIVPLKRTIEGHPYHIPAKAYELGLVYEGGQRRLFSIN